MVQLAWKLLFHESKVRMNRAANVVFVDFC